MIGLLLGSPVDADVGRQDAEERVLTRDGARVGNHVDLATAGVEVRCAPKRGAGCLGLGVPLLLGEVVLRNLSQIFVPEPARGAIAIGRKSTRYARRIDLKGATVEVWVVGEVLVENRVNGVGRCRRWARKLRRNCW